MLMFIEKRAVFLFSFESRRRSMTRESYMIHEYTHRSKISLSTLIMAYGGTRLMNRSALSLSLSRSLELGQSEKSILLGNFSRRGRHAGEHTPSACGAAHADMKVSDVLAGAAASDLLGAPSPLLAAPSPLLAAPSSLLAAAWRMLTRALRPRP